VLRKVVLDSPTMNLFRRSIRSAVAVRSAAIPLLEELLILALEFIVENDAADARAFAAETLGSVRVRAVDLRVVGQLAWLLDARVESLMPSRASGLSPWRCDDRSSSSPLHEAISRSCRASIVGR
jgi:hypothetical protein